MNYYTDVVVIGAGAVGLTLANELVRHGLKPRIVDRAPGIREVSKAMILHVRTQEVLDKLGASERLVTEAQPLTEVVVHAYGKHVGAWDLDNLPAHNIVGARLAIEAVGASMRFLPPYRPDFNPIEIAFSKFKAFLRKAAAHTVNELWDAIAEAIETYSPTECPNYFAAAGYDAD